MTSPVLSGARPLIGGRPWYVQNADKPYSLAIEAGHFCFEARTGECWAGAGDDPTERVAV